MRIAYREGDGLITKDSVSLAFSSFVPASLSGFSILRDSRLKLSSVVGKPLVKSRLLRAVRYASDPSVRALGVRRSNVLVFYGRPGTGKTHMAKALAGEVGWPFINVKASAINRYGRGYVTSALQMASRFNRCVLFIDDADRLLGRPVLSEDSFDQGMLLSALDSVEGMQEGIVIFGMNRLDRFSDAFTDRVVTVRFDAPDASERLAFFSCRASSSKIPVDVSVLVDGSDGLRYREMEKVWDEVAFAYSDGVGLDSEFVMGLCREFKPREEKRGMWG